MYYKGIVFDLDGVICFTDEYHYVAWKEAADTLGVYFDRNINNRLRGVSRAESLEIILEKCGRALSPEDRKAVLELKNSRYITFLEKMQPSDVASEVLETLNALRQTGIKLAIGSSSKNAKIILRQIGLENFFDAISDGTNISRSKPDPEVFIKAAGFMGLQPSDCLVVEDAIAGIEAAYAGGFKSAALGDAKNSDKANYRLHSFMDLLDLAR